MFWLVCLLTALFAAPAAFAAEGGVRISDIEGREVQLPALPTRILLGEGHLLVAMSLVHPDPASLVVASQGDLKRHSPDIHDRFRAASPRAIDAIAIVGEASPDTFSVENALAAMPDLAIFGGTYGPSARSSEVIERLTAAGVPVVFVDFFTAPLRNTAPSMRILGKVLGREAQGEAFSNFYEGRLRRVTDRVRGLAPPDSPSVFLQAFGGVWDCCWMPGKAGLGEFIAAAGGRNLGAVKFPGRPWGQASLEFVLTENPDIYITTGNPHMARAGGTVLGTGVTDAIARRSFEAMLGKGEIAALPAVENHRAFGLWHLLHGLPLNIVAVEAFAKWFHPELFRDVDPAATMAEINAAFLSVPLPGTFLIGPE